MKLRFIFVSILALALMAPAALASNSADSTTNDESASSVEGGTNDNNGKAKGKAKSQKVKKHPMKSLCWPRVGVVVRGELLNVDAAAGEFTVKVDKANRHGKRFLDGEATFKLWKKGKVRIKTDKVRKATLAELETALAETPGIRVKVSGRGCKSELKDDAATPDLYAKHVKAKTPAIEQNVEATDQQATDAQNSDGSTTDPA